MAGDVQQVFGANILEYVMRLTQGQIDYLPRLPKHIIIHIIQFLELSDIAALAQVSKQFRRVLSLFSLLLYSLIFKVLLLLLLLKGTYLNQRLWHVYYVFAF